MTQRDYLKNIIYSNFLIICIYPILHTSLFYGLHLDIIWSIIFLGYNIPHLKEISTIVAEYYTKINRKSNESIQSSGVENIIISAKDNSTVHYITTPSKKTDKNLVDE